MTISISFRATLLSAAAFGAVATGSSLPAQTTPPPPTTVPDRQERPSPSERGNQVVVTGSRPQVIDAPDRLSFNVANDLGAQTGSLADALRNVPGVEVDLEGRVSLRGDPGVTILIDGRPSSMLRGEGRGDALLSMPANQIERVEVITNPSAAFSPEGSGGVLNLITRKARQAGTSGTLRTSVGTRGNGAISLNGALTRPGTTISGDIGLRRFANEIDVEQQRQRIDPLTGATLTSSQLAEYDNVGTAANARLGVERDLDKKNRITGEISYRDIQVKSDREEEYFGTVGEPSFGRVSETDQRIRNLGLRSSWRRTLPGKDHVLQTDLEFDRGWLERSVSGRTTTAPLSFEDIGNDADRLEARIKLDYKKPLGEGRSLNLGYEYELSDADLRLTGARGSSADLLFPVPGLTNSFDFRQGVHALYGTYQVNRGKWEFQPGVRLEQVDLDLKQRTDGTRYDQNYLRVYPTVHVGRAFGERHKLRGSYSRRIQRPGPLELSPFIFYIDPRNVRRGNPDLKPETTDAFELSWQYRKDATFLSLTGFYRRAKDGFTDVVEILDDGVLLTTRANLGTGSRLGVDAIINGRLSKKLNYNLSGTVQRVELDGDGIGTIGEVSDIIASARGTVTWQPNAKDYVQLSGNYFGKQLLPQGYRRAGGIVNLGYRRKLNDKVSLLLTGQNILDTAKQEIVIRTPVVRDRLEQKVNGRAFLVGLTYNFGGTSNRRRQEQGFDFDPNASTVGP